MKAHGSHSSYVSGCRCEECRRANRDYARKLRKRRAYGQLDFVDAEPVRERVQELMARGMGVCEIARAAGIHRSTLYALMRAHHHTGRPVSRMKRETAEAIMAIRRRSPQGGWKVGASTTRAATLDLMILGYSMEWIARQVGLTRSNFRPFDRDRVRLSTQRAVLALRDATTEPAPTRTPGQRASATHSRRWAWREMERSAA